MITLEQVCVRYPQAQHKVLDDVCLCVQARETVTILGGSGTGKSTILRAILRLLPLTSGRITVDGQDIATLDRIALRRSIGMVFQGDSLFNHMSVEHNIGLVLKLSGTKTSVVKSRVEELMELVGLPPRDYAKRYPHALSGGQQQRVGVARALATQPAYLLMDEPFGALDSITRRSLQDELKMLRKRLGITILFVTHDVMEAVSLGDRLAVMDNGKLVQSGTVRELMDRPASDAVRLLVGTPLMQLSTFVKDSVS